MSIGRLSDKLMYQEKDYFQKTCDLILTPLHVALNGKTVYCLTTKIDPAYAEEEPSIHFFSVNGSNSPLKRIACGILTVAIAPFTLLTLLAKQYSREQELWTHFHKKIEKAGSSSVINWQYQLGIFLSVLPTDPMLQEAHILADKQLSTQKHHLDHFHGNTSYASARELRKRLEAHKEIASIASVLPVFQEYESWCYRTSAITILHCQDLDATPLVDNLLHALQARLEALSPRDILLFPASFRISKKNTYHLLVVKIGREFSGIHSLTIYNVGLGTNHHAMRIQDNTSYVYPLYFSDFFHKKMASDSFLRSFILHTTCYYEETEEIDGFYHFLRNFFIAPLLPDTNHTCRQIQSGPTCTWRSPLATLKDLLPHEAYKNFIFKIKQESIQSIYEKYLKQDVETHERDFTHLKPWLQEKRDAYLLASIGIEEFHKRIKKPLFTNSTLINRDILHIEEVIHRYPGRPVLEASSL